MSARRRLETPRHDGAILADPPLANLTRLIADNRRRLNEPGPDILGRSLADLRHEAQLEASAASKDYLSRNGEPVPDSQSTSFFLAGHQPDLFHPGVWIKNFALHGLAKAHGATPLNLIVDSDAAKPPSIRVPTVMSGVGQTLLSGNGPQPDQVKLVTVPIDRWKGEVPYEELHVTDEARFAGVDKEVMRLLQPWGFMPVIGSFWQEVLRLVPRTKILGERLAAARRTFERQWNCHNLELPVSRVCQTKGFAWFACHLLTHLLRFQAAYNTGVKNYRKRYGLRSHSHPVPELASKDGWLESPFWVWRTDQPKRRPLWARQAKTEIELRMEQTILGRLPLGDAEQAVSFWQDLERRSIKVRSRALITTLFARLFLGDFMIHGIGGGKYDEVTDEIIRNFYQVEPPEYLVLSGTLHLPVPAFPAQREQCQRLARDIRDLHWNPQRHLDEPMSTSRLTPAARLEMQNLVAHKQEWIARQPHNSSGRRERFQKLREYNALLERLLSGKEKRLQEMRGQCEREVEANQILQSREYAFCLFPEEKLRPFCTQFL